MFSSLSATELTLDFDRRYATDKGMLSPYPERTHLVTMPRQHDHNQRVRVATLDITKGRGLGPQIDFRHLANEDKYS